MEEQFKKLPTVHERMRTLLDEVSAEAELPVSRTIMDSEYREPLEEEVALRENSQDSPEYPDEGVSVDEETSPTPEAIAEIEEPQPREQPEPPEESAGEPRFAEPVEAEIDEPEIPEPVAAEVDEPEIPEPVQTEVDEPDVPAEPDVEPVEPEVLEIPEQQGDVFGGLQWDGFDLPDFVSGFVDEAAQITADKMAQNSAMLSLQFQDKLDEYVQLMDRRGAF